MPVISQGWVCDGYDITFEVGKQRRTLHFRTPPKDLDAAEMSVAEMLDAEARAVGQAPPDIVTPDDRLSDEERKKRLLEASYATAKAITVEYAALEAKDEKADALVAELAKYVATYEASSKVAPVEEERIG